MAFFRVGGSGGSNMLLPQKTIAQNIGTSGTTSISVTKKPKLMIYGMWERTGQNYKGVVAIIDVANQTAKRSGYYGGSATFYNWVDWAWSGVQNYFPTISASNVVYNNAAYGANHRMMLMIY